MGALANPQVGGFVNRHFAATYVKVGTFALVNGEKQGGNVATYFCLPDGRVLHAIAGPVDAGTFLNEARWAVHIQQRASLEGRNDPGRFRQVVRQAHVERLARMSYSRPEQLERWLDDVGVSGDFASEGRGSMATARMVLHQRLMPDPNRDDSQFRVHLLAALFPLEKIEDIYQYVFENILGEKLSSLPVAEIKANPYRRILGAVKDEAIREAVK